MTSNNAPPLSDGHYAEFYQLRKNASTMTCSAIDWVRQYLPVLLDEVGLQAQSDTLSLLSIGSGEGDIDIEVIRTILSCFHPRWETVQYDAIEPNQIHRERFLEHLDQHPFDPRVNVLVHDTFYGNDFGGEDKYDFVLIFHVLYYFEAPEKIIQQVLKQLKPNGRIIIIHQSETGIPKIQQTHLLDLKGNENELFTTENIRQLLTEQRLRYRYYSINAFLELTECFKQSDVGLKILSFCMECDLREIPIQKLEKLLQSVKNHTSPGENTLYEPIGAFVVDKENTHFNIRQLEEDHDPVADYRQLAQRFDWQKVFLSIDAPTIRLLDVACGTGRWIDAFIHYVESRSPQISGKKVRYDLLDNSGNALRKATQKICLPLELGNQHMSSIQTSELENDYYDVIWSMHGFYAIQQQDLTSALKRMRAALSEAGQIFIAQATRRSFYVDFYTQYLNIFNKAGEKFTAAEDITAALEALNIEYQVHVIDYHEQINEADIEAVSHYILNEATVNSFSGEGYSDEITKPKGVHLEDLLANSSMETYLRSFIKDSTYYFPEEVWLISFKKQYE